MCCSVVSSALKTTLHEEKPQLVFYNAGVDPHKDDSLGRLSLTDEGLLRRDLLVRHDQNNTKLLVTYRAQK